MWLVAAFALAGGLAQLVDGTLGMGFGVTSATVLLALGVAPATAKAANRWRRAVVPSRTAWSSSSTSGSASSRTPRMAPGRVPGSRTAPRTRSSSGHCGAS